MKAVNGFLHPSATTRQSVAVPAEVTMKYGVRPVLLTSRPRLGDDRMFVLPIQGNQVLEIEHSELSQIAYAKDIPTLFHTFNLSYIVGAVFHHCKQLAEAYSEICRTFVSLPFPEEMDSDLVNLAHQPEPYYEFEGLITAARRAYDTTRYLIWHAFGPKKGSLPSSFEKTLRLCTCLPISLDERLHLSWSRFGNKVKKYRDCIQHYVPIGGLLPSARMVRLEGGVWSTSLIIPDNPEARSHTEFKYKSRLDALTYGWEVTNEVIEIAQAIVQAVPEQEGSQ